MKWSLLLLMLLCGCNLQVPVNPKPQPEPPPIVNPITVKEGWLIVVEEQAERIDNGSFKLLNDTLYWDSLKGWQRRFIDDDDHPAVDPYLEKVTKAGVKEPALIIMGNDGTVKKVIELPKSKESLSLLLGI